MDAIFDLLDYMFDLLDLIRTLAIVGLVVLVLTIVLQIIILLSVSGFKEQFSRFHLNYNKDHNRYPQ